MKHLKSAYLIRKSNKLIFPNFFSLHTFKRRALYTYLLNLLIIPSALLNHFKLIRNDSMIFQTTRPRSSNQQATWSWTGKKKQNNFIVYKSHRKQHEHHTSTLHYTATRNKRTGGLLVTTIVFFLVRFWFSTDVFLLTWLEFYQL